MGPGSSAASSPSHVVRDPPHGVVVDTTHIYWLNPPRVLPEAIARANLDGTAVDERFIDDFDFHTNWPIELAVDAEHVYWVDRCMTRPI